DVIRQALHLADAGGMECLPNEEIFTELVHIGYEKPPPKLTFYKAFFFSQWKFLIHTLVQCISAKRTAWNKFSCSMASVVICLARGRKFNFSKYIFDSMVRNVDSPSKFLIVGKGFSGVETPLFATMLLKKRVKKLEKKRISKSSSLKRLIKVGGRIKAIDVDEDITLVDVETQVDDEFQGRKDDVSVVAIKDAGAAEPTMFDDEEITMTMAQTLIKMKVEKEKDDFEKAKVLQQQYVYKEENIDWNFVVEQIQEKHLDNIRKYQSLKRKPISIAQARKNMIVYLKNMDGYKMGHFRGITYDKVRPIFERNYNKVQTLFKPDKDEEPTKKR
nr:hypothetical protein [Tanacetum cinerariifolium]